MASAFDNDDRTLYIGNVDKNVTEEILYELFLQAGPIERVSISCNNNNSYHYGFVTYKYECSVDYAIKLYKGTNLYKKELIIKKKGSRNNNSGQQICNKNNLNTFDSDQPSLNSKNQDFNQDQLNNFQQNFFNLNCNVPPLINFSCRSFKGNHSNYKKPYDRNPRNYQTSRSRDTRGPRKDRNYRNTFYHNRKNRNKD